MGLKILEILLDIILIISTCYLICIAVFTYGLYSLAERYDRYNKEKKIKVSILISARNEAKHIENLLESLYNQSFPKELFEIIIVDDHSEDETEKIVNIFINNHKDIKIKLLKLERIGKKAAISMALHNAANEYIIVTDADCLVSSEWIESIVGYYQKTNSKMILGPVLLFPANTLFEKIQVLEHLSLIASTAGSAAIGIPVMCNGANMAYKREDALKMEKERHDFNIASGDDMFLMEQFIRFYGNKSVTFLLNKSAIVKTKTMKTIKDFFKQRRRWVSKTKSYTNWKIILTASIVFLFNLSIIFIFAGAFFIPALWSLYVLLIILKFLVDLPILYNIAGFMNQKKLLLWAFPLEFVYPFYVVFTTISGLLTKVNWKRN